VHWHFGQFGCVLIFQTMPRVGPRVEFHKGAVAKRPSTGLPSQLSKCLKTAGFIYFFYGSVICFYGALILLSCLEVYPEGMSDIIFQPLIAVYIVILCLLSIPLGIVIGRRFLNFDEEQSNCSWGHWILGEASAREMSWQLYAGSLFLFHIFGGLFLTMLLCFQHRLPLNPQHLDGMPFDLALNTAISFITNTNWQAYSGESTLSYFSQMVGLGVQNFLSAATGIAVLLALARALRRREIITIGNFWLDIMRATVFILVPLSFVFALILIQQGVPQTFSPYITVHTLEGLQQLIPLGPVASQVAIKQLGTNGGGFYCKCNTCICAYRNY
jgi:K+-transporting ATPase A subunit